MSPANADQDRDGWLSDLLGRADDDANDPRGRGPAPQPQRQAAGNPLESLSLDIGRLLDPDMAAAAQRAVDAVDADALRRHLDGLAALLPTADHDALGEPPGAEDVAEDMRGVL